MSEILRYTLSHPSYLPSSYTPVAYLESSRSLWIDTGFKPTGKTSIYADLGSLTITGNTCWFGTNNGTSATSGAAFEFFHNATHFDYCYATTSNTTGTYSYIQNHEQINSVLIALL